MIIKNTYSKIAEESYNASICAHCGSMFGDWFMPGYWYDEPVESIEVEIDLVRDDYEGNRLI